MLTSEDILGRVRDPRFVPIRFVTSSGESYEVHDPDMVWVGRRDIHLGMSSRRSPSIYEQVSRVSLLHITTMEGLPVKEGKSNGNGRK